MNHAPFTRRRLQVLIAFGVGTLVLGFFLSGILPSLYGDRTAGPSSYSVSLQGHHALVEWLRRLEIPVVRCRTPGATPLRSDFPVLLLEPVACHDLAEGPPDELGPSVSDLLRYIDEAGAAAVIVLPKRTYHPDPERPGWIIDEAEDRSAAPDLLEKLLPESRAAVLGATGYVRHPGGLTDLDASALGVRAPVVDLHDPQVLVDVPGMTPLLHGREGVLIGALDSGPPGSRRYIVSDPDLLNNRGLGRGDHAVLMHALLTEELRARGVVVDESLHGFRVSRSALQRAFSFPLALIVLHALLLAGLFAWAAAARFGKALTPPPALPPGKALLLQNTGKLLLAAGDHGGAVRRYLRVCMADVAERFAFGEVRSGRDLMARMKAVTEARGLPFPLPEIDRLARREKLTPAEAVELALEVRAWRTALEHPDRTDQPDRVRPRRRPGTDA